MLRNLWCQQRFMWFCYWILHPWHLWCCWHKRRFQGHLQVCRWSGARHPKGARRRRIWCRPKRSLWLMSDVHFVVFYVKISTIPSHAASFGIELWHYVTSLPLSLGQTFVSSIFRPLFWSEGDLVGLRFFQPHSKCFGAMNECSCIRLVLAWNQ